MKEVLFVEGFLKIKKADFEIKRLNVIIGPQANGKSLLAKLAYFFRSVPQDHFLGGLEKSSIRGK